MTLKDICIKLYGKIDKKYKEQFGYAIKDTSIDNIIEYFYAPKDASSLAVTRMLFGLCMIFDIPDERGGAILEQRWGNPKICHFPLFPFITAQSLPFMAIVYLFLMFGAICITLGYSTRVSCLLFTISYWYLFLIEKSFWNNHSYLFGLIAFLLCFTQAYNYWSIDVYVFPKWKRETVPYWNYFVLKYQIFILYFMAGLKKGTAEWLTGYSVQKLSEHWVFGPFKLFLDTPEIDYYIVHWFIFLFDLTIAFWMMWAKTRNVAMFFCALFHLMNSRLFRIGMFPWVCLATMPLFYPFDWPKRVMNFFKKYMLSYFHFGSDESRDVSNEMDEIDGEQYDESNECYDDDIHCEVHEFDNDNTIQKYNENIYEKVWFENNDEEIIKTIGETVQTSRNCKPSSKFQSQNVQLVGLLKKKTEKELKTEVSVTDKVKANIKCKECLKELKKEQKKRVKEEKIESICYRAKKAITTLLIFLYMYCQLILPYISTKGFNNWTSGLYGYSWDMMVHTWDTQSVVLKMVDNNRSKEYYLDPYAYAPNDRWTRHGDMVYQYAHCLKDKVIKEAKEKNFTLSNNISIYVDVWTSFNGRFTQRLFDPKVDLLNTSWSPFEDVPFLIPLLAESLEWRKELDAIREDVSKWSCHTEVIFFADLPGYALDKFIPPELQNVSLTILRGPVALETPARLNQIGQSFILNTGNTTKLESGYFHKVLNIGPKPAFYMYTFENQTEIMRNITQAIKPKLPIFKEFYSRLSNMIVFVKLVMKNIFTQCIWKTNCQCCQ